MIDENGMPDASLVAQTMNAGGYLASEASKAARRCFPVLYARRDKNALGVSTDALIENTQKILDSNLPGYLKDQTVALMQAKFVHQGNVDATVRIAVDSGRIKGDANPDILDDEWVENYVEHVKKVTDEEVRRTWANLLVEELNNSGSFSKRAMSTLSIMEKTDAGIFMRFASNVVMIHASKESLESVPVVFLGDEEEHPETLDSGLVSLNDISVLTSFSLVLASSWYNVTVDPGDTIQVSVANETIEVGNFTDQKISVTPWHYHLSAVGKQLLNLCDCGVADGVAENMKTYLARERLTIVSES